MLNSEYLKIKYPEFKDIGQCYQKMLKDFLGEKNNLMILSAGCGNRLYVPELLKNKGTIIGIDIEKNALNNNDVNEVILGSLDKLPFNDNSFDLIMAEWVLEHLENPSLAINEFYRVLKKNGAVIFMTTNIYSPFVFLNKLLPVAFAKFFRQRFLKISESDTFPAYYRLNSQSKIKKIFQQNDFVCQSFKLAGVLNYFSFNKLLLNSAILFDKLTNYIFCSSKTHLAGYFVLKNKNGNKDNYNNRNFFYQCLNCGQKLDIANYQKSERLLTCPRCFWQTNAKMN